MTNPRLLTIALMLSAMTANVDLTIAGKTKPEPVPQRKPV